MESNEQVSYEVNGWDRYQKLVLFRLDEQQQKLNSIDKRLVAVQTSVSLLKFKVGLIGAGAGFLAAILQGRFH